MNTRSSHLKLFSVLGNHQRLDGGAMFGNAPKSVWSQWAAPDEKNRILLQCRCLLVQDGHRYVLFETGIGAFFEPKLAERYGVTQPEHELLKNLARLGISDAAIDTIVLSHLHFDHAGGLLATYSTGSSPRLLFPNARYVVGEEAYERAKEPHSRDRASFIPELLPLLEKSGRLVIVKGSSDPRVFPEWLSFRYSHGHTPGQLHSVIATSPRRLVFAGDLIPGMAWIHLPLTMGYDRFAEMVIDEKKSLYEDFLGHDVFFTHDEKYSVATLGRDEKKYLGLNPVAELQGL